MAYSIQRAVSDGNMTLLPISIEYFDREEISVLFNGVQNARQWAWVGTTDKTLSFTPPVANTVEVMVVRSTDLSELRHKFSLGAQFTAGSLDESLLQVLHIAQEATERQLGGDFFTDIDMHGHVINNLADAVWDQQAVTYKQLKAVASGVIGVVDVPASTVTYTPAGVSAVTTDVHSKLRESVSVKDFGAIGDGVADDTSKFNHASAAVSALSGQVYVPRGAYKLSSNTSASNWVVDSGVSFVGPGKLTGRIVRMGGFGLYSKGGKIGSFDDYVTTGIRPFTEDASELSVLSTIGQIGLLGGSKTSLSAVVGSQGCIGLAGFVNNDNTAQIQSCYGSYLESRRQVGAGTTHGQEIDIVNFGTVAAVSPGAMVQDGLTNALWLASGGGAVGAVDSSLALGIINNGAKFEKGIVFGTGSLVNTSGEGQAIVLDKSHSITWFDGQARTVRIRSDASTPSVGIVFSNGAINFQTMAGSTFLKLDTTGQITMTSALKLNMPNLNFSGFTTTNTASAGPATALPAQPMTYLQVQVNGTNVKIPCYGA